MKTQKTLFLTLIALSLIFSGCFSPWAGGDQGTITISIGGNGQARGMWKGDDGRYYETKYLLHIITITGPGTEQEQRFIDTGTASFVVATGRWHIEVKAYDLTQYEDKSVDIEITENGPPLVAEGSDDFYVKAGNNSVKIEMVSPGSQEPPEQSSDKFQVTLVLNGGLYDDDETGTYSEDYQEFYINVENNQSYTLKEPTKSGFEFGGWYNNSNFIDNSIQSVNAETTLYAKWVNNTPTLTLTIGVIRGQDGKTLTREKWGSVEILRPKQTGTEEGNDSYSCKMNIQSEDYVTVQAYTETGYEFVEWRTTYRYEEGTTVYTDGDNAVNPYNFTITKDTTLYAVFKPTDDTKLITSEADMAKIGKETNYPLDGNYVLIADLDLNNWTPIGTGENPFTGTFDGMGHSITLGNNINYVASVTSDDSTTEFYAGLFGVIGKNGTVKNLDLACSINLTQNATGPLCVGAVAGKNGGLIKNVISSVNIIIGSPDTSSGQIHIGGIAGQITNVGNIKNCASIGKIGDAESTNITCAGGIVGSINGGGDISYCWSSSAISASDYGGYAGGIAGLIIADSSTTGSIKNCVAVNTSINSNNKGRILSGSIPAGFQLSNNYAKVLNITSTDDVGHDKPDGAEVPSFYDDDEYVDEWWNDDTRWDGGNWNINSSSVNENNPWKSGAKYTDNSPTLKLWFNTN